MSYTEELNAEQKEAVLHIDGPLLILAGAGSGKTRVLTHRIARLVDELGVFPGNILAITFTNKAAKEMKERVEALLGSATNNMWISTFHSTCVRILRREITKLGYDRNFVIYDSADQQTLIKECLSELQLNDKNFPPRSCLDQISRAKNELIDVESFKKLYASDFRMAKYGEIYQLYQKKLKEYNALDFDDLINLTIEVFKKDSLVLSYYQEKFKYVMVDEYQDTNTSQYTLIHMITEKHKNLCVVGDDDQSIYGWRGANIRNILDFEKDFKNCKVIKLEQNYRSTPEIIDVANEVIKNNQGRKAKKLWTGLEKGEKPRIYRSSDQHDEARFVCREIKKQKEMYNRVYSDFAVLYRTNAQSRTFEEQFIREGIPYGIFGGLKFYDRKEIKDILAYFKLIVNPVDQLSLMRVINYPKRGIGKATIDAAVKLAEERARSLYDILKEADNYKELSRASNKILGFCQLIEKLRVYSESMNLQTLFDELIEETGIIEEYNKENTIEASTKIENIKELKSVMIDFEKSEDPNIEDKSLESFLAQVSLTADIDDLEEGSSQVTLMTLHSAKGLEFPVVFMVGMDEGVFPGIRSMDSESEMEEERRLCYVGVTRAKEQLYMINAFSRTIYGKTERYMPSRFFSEIPEEKVEWIDGGYQGLGYGLPTGGMKARYSRPAEPNQGPLIRRGFGSPSNVNFDYKVGQNVTHKKFGVGVIKKIEGTGQDQKLEIEFENFGMRRLMTAFAGLKTE